jgi:HJR/Mrr/RecB family endonuclease
MSGDKPSPSIRAEAMAREFERAKQNVALIDQAYSDFYSTVLRNLWKEFNLPSSCERLNEQIFSEARELWSEAAIAVLRASDPLELEVVETLVSKQLEPYTNWNLISANDYGNFSSANTTADFLKSVAELVERISKHTSSNPVTVIATNVLIRSWTDWKTRVAPLSNEFINAVREISGEFLLWLGLHPEALDRVSWEAFEKIIAEVFASHGFEVELTGRARGDSADIMAIRRDELGIATKYLIEIKRYKRSRRVGLAIVNGVIGAARRADAHHALLVTSSSFTHDVLQKRSEFEAINLHLRDGEAVREWLRDYTPRKDGGLWLLRKWDQ